MERYIVSKYFSLDLVDGQTKVIVESLSQYSEFKKKMYDLFAYRNMNKNVCKFVSFEG